MARLLAVILTSLITGYSAKILASAATPKIISRAALLQENNKDDPKLSPDSGSVAFSEVANGATNVWIASSAALQSAKLLITITIGSLGAYFWTFDSRHGATAIRFSNQS
jgi:Tol biopolymer transport system component